MFIIQADITFLRVIYNLEKKNVFKKRDDLLITLSIVEWFVYLYLIPFFIIKIL